MGQKVNPISFRLGVYRFWDSRWFAKKSYGEQLMEDFRIRKYLEDTLENAEISHVEIEKAGDNIKVIIHSARAGVVIGKKGQEIDRLRRELAKMLKVPSIEISVQEVKVPELNATVVAKNVASQLERRTNFKKAMSRATSTAMRAGAKGIKVCVAGRLGGAEIARSEWSKMGSVPLHTLRSDIDYGFAEAMTTYGIIGVKVWICRGDFQLKKN